MYVSVKLGKQDYKQANIFNPLKKNVIIQRTHGQFLNTKFVGQVIKWHKTIH